MAIRVPVRAVPERPAPPRPTVTRLRLTCVYGGVFLLAGTALLVVVFLLARQAVDRGSEPVFELRAEGALVLAPADCPVPAGGGPSPCPAAGPPRPRDPLTSSALIALAALGPLSVAAGYVTAGYALSPFRRIAHTAQQAGR
ncbi:hypothetical protein ACIPW5_05270 [Streptomyces sp. NPDC090077]|uniref:hypothetical protein n=1 Tax=Streptomyces sp. NPDC090077 TaxID=3365938 RepID=UPI003820206C